MLRNVLKRCNFAAPVVQRRLLSATGPSPTTTVLLQNVPSSATETSLRAALQGISFRKIEMEPGCALHLGNEAEAIYASSILHKKYNSVTNISSTTMPSLTLQNLPSTVNLEKLSKSFSKYQPKIIRMAGQPTIQVIHNGQSQCETLS
jgi:hypothetical protein